MSNLLQACRKGHLDAVNDLLLKGANMEAMDYVGHYLF